ncbi:DUF2065 domain-containing protein [Alkalicaulis satelles]|uniref:DUF2065 domain-containing protein n=1 Tax=Alkalicaulis satelles TaxID=2609175 RepID=A0A5M6ZKY6_9PROT|nr:DUF2065 domain-containing protein [Alkalicaulis satelles]KAA5804625.1 DUF2065 domain-containing protein [Alkalicaulis satelles]
MEWLLIGLGVALVLEGVCYAAAPGAMQRMAALIGEARPSHLRTAGLFAVAVGVFIVALVTGRA